MSDTTKYTTNQVDEWSNRRVVDELNRLAGELEKATKARDAEAKDYDRVSVQLAEAVGVLTTILPVMPEDIMVRPRGSVDSYNLKERVATILAKHANGGVK